VSFELSPQMRIVALVGLVVVLLGGGGFFFLGHKQPAAPAAPALSAAELVKRAHASHPGVAHAKPKPAAHTRAHAHARVKPKATVKAKPELAPKPKPKPKISLYQNLPSSLLAALQRSQLVVAVVFNPGAPDDRIAHDEALVGARSVGAGFVALNVLSQADISQITRTYGLIQDPSVLIFRRPGVVIGRLNGFADSSSVAQAVEENAPDDVAAPAAPPMPATHPKASSGSGDADKRARTNLVVAIPAVEAYNADNKGYVGMTPAKLRGYDKTVKTVTIVGTPSATSYCLRSTVGKKSWYKRGPGGKITTTPCSGP
jgi:hypothetical protein